MAETFESRRADDEAVAVAAERIRSGAADHKEDGGSTPDAASPFRQAR